MNLLIKKITPVIFENECVYIYIGFKYIQYDSIQEVN